MTKPKLMRSALETWQARVTNGDLGERPEDFRTWHYDALWRAACWEAAGRRDPELPAPLPPLRDFAALLERIGPNDGSAYWLSTVLWWQQDPDAVWAYLDEDVL